MAGRGVPMPSTSREAKRHERIHAPLRLERCVLAKIPTTKVPATIVTGFLGAGKTTMIRHLLENAGERRLALLVNEFGDVGVDGEVLRACGVKDCPEIIELANGCICCTVADDFLPAIEKLLALDPPPEHIVIETSGLALPKPLVKAFDWPDVRRRLTVDGVIAVVDGAAVAAGRYADDPAKLAAQRAADPSVEHDNPLEEVYEDQLLCADLVVLNKCDLLDEATAPTRRSGDPRHHPARREGGGHAPRPAGPSAAARPRRSGRGRSRAAPLAPRCRARP